MSYSEQQICALTASVAQRRPLLSPVLIAKNVAKLYRLASSLRNRGVVESTANRASELARELGGMFEYAIYADEGDTVAEAHCFLQIDNYRERIV